MPEVTHTEEAGATIGRRPLLIAAGTAASVLLVVIAFLSLRFDDILERRLRQETIELLGDRFDSEVELGTVDVQLQPLRVRFDRLVLRHRGRRDIPPVISIRMLAIEGGLFELWNRRLRRVHVEGLEIVIPPRRRANLPPLTIDRDDGATSRGPVVEGGRPDVLIHELVSEGARLTIMPKREGKTAREFLLHTIRFEGLQFSRPTPFQASLTNPVPKGLIQTMGTFGPWVSDEPGLTPVEGTFTFDADLGTIKGIGGRLDSEGSFSGPIEEIRTSGQTWTPAFRITALDGQPMPLSTRFKAVVDGTDGDVILEEVLAAIGASSFLVKGGVVGVKGVKGRRIILDVRSTDARIEDVLALIMKGHPPLLGRLAIQAKLDLPPSQADVDVIDRMRLDGEFRIAKARFASARVQEKIDELARRGMGRPGDRALDDVASDMRGRVHIENGRLRIDTVTFAVPGATVTMGGVYDLRTETLDFSGVVRLRARASQTTKGFKSWLLKPLDPLLRKQGAGTRLAIKVTGTRDRPQIRPDLKRTLLGR